MPPAVTVDYGGVSASDPIVPLRYDNTNSEQKSKSSYSKEESNAKQKARKRPVMTRDEVLKNSNVETLCLIIINDKVYDCTRWQNTHPGGHLTIRALCGKDGTGPFYATHTKEIIDKWLYKFYYGDVDMSDQSHLHNRDITKDQKIMRGYRELTRFMEDAGMFETSYTYYALLFTWLFTLLGTALYLTLAFDSKKIHLLGAVILGLFWQQAPLVGHDLGHNGITHDRIMDSKLGLLFGNFLSGIGIGWWKRGHNVHHIVTNSREHDPDIQHLPLFAVSPKFLEEPIYSTWFNHYLTLNPLSHVLVGVQHYLFYPIMAFARYNLYVQSILHALGVGLYSEKNSGKAEVLWRRDLQLASLCGFVSWVVLVTAQLPTWTERFFWLTVAHGVSGILHVQITVSHFPMPNYSGVTYDDDHNGFLKTQMEGTMDIDCPWYLDWFHGGLQFQTVHHLWPRLPRHNLRRAQVFLASLCKEHGQVYHRATFYEANLLLLNTLKTTAATSGIWDETFYESINLIG